MRSLPYPQGFGLLPFDPSCATRKVKVIDPDCYHLCSRPVVEARPRLVGASSASCRSSAGHYGRRSGGGGSWRRVDNMVSPLVRLPQLRLHAAAAASRESSSSSFRVTRPCRPPCGTDGGRRGRVRDFTFTHETRPRFCAFRFRPTP